MGTTSNILTLLQGFSSKQRTPVVEFSEFAEYVRHYAQHHLNENVELQAYLGSTDDTLQEELSKLSVAHKIVLTNKSQGGQSIFVISSFINRYAETYKEIETNISIPFPNMNDIPKNVPNDIVTKIQASDAISNLLNDQSMDDKALYAFGFAKNIPALLFPSSVSVAQLIKLSLKKLQDFLRKGESHDYFLKKLTISNPGKELSIKNFFSLFVSRPEDAFDQVKLNGDNFYNWTQLCYFIKQDYNKLKDFTVEDVNVLQSISIIEMSISFYKNKSTEKNQKDAAFKEFDGLLENPPYYFSKSDIEGMRDAYGKLLLGQYTREELNDHLSDLREDSIGNSLPKLLVFKVNDATGYFILKDKVMPLIIRLCNDARSVVREAISRHWYKSLMEFEVLPEMKDQTAFENCMERELQAADPVLYALLHSSFLPVVAFEDNTPGRLTLFRNGILVPYSELLLISRQEIYSNAKIRLPLYYTLPVISWIVSLFKRKPKEKKPKKTYETATFVAAQEEKAKEEAKQNELNASDRQGPKSRARAIRTMALSVEKDLVPENSSLERELKAYLSEWNDRLDPKVFDNLTLDINNLIRDYLRKVLRTFKNEDVSRERIESLAKSLDETPSLMKIKNHAALRRYIELYVVKLLKNLPSS